MTKKRLCMLCNSTDYFLSHRLPLALAAKEAGYTIYIVGPETSEQSVKEIKKHFEFHRIPLYRKSVNPLNELKLLYQIIKAFHHIKPDIVHNVTIKPVIYGGVAARLLSIPATVNSITGLGYIFTGASLKQRILKPIVSFLYKVSMGHKNSCTIFQNPDDQHQFLKSNILPSEKTKLIRGSGVDINLYKSTKLRSNKPFQVLLPARMLWDKGIGEFVEAAKEIQKNSSRAWEFLLAGGLDQENPAAIPEKTVRLWEEAGIVKWLGQCSNMIALFNQVDVVCLPSYREGVPRALLEAAACECPIVTTDAPGCREVVIDKKTGFMVPLKDSRSLVEALEKIAALPKAELKKMGKEGRLLIQNNFTIEHVIDATLDIYTQLQRC